MRHVVISLLVLLFRFGEDIESKTVFVEVLWCFYVSILLLFSTDVINWKLIWKSYFYLALFLLRFSLPISKSFLEVTFLLRNTVLKGTELLLPLPELLLHKQQLLLLSSNLRHRGSAPPPHLNTYSFMATHIQEINQCNPVTSLQIYSSCKLQENPITAMSSICWTAVEGPALTIKLWSAQCSPGPQRYLLHLRIRSLRTQRTLH